MNAVKILVVEDESLIGLNMQLMLEENGYECRLACSGEDAIAMMNEYGPDLILFDIQLNGKVDGITAARIIRKEHDAMVPIIYTTRLGDDLFFNQAKETWPHDYLIKPFSNRELLRKIELAIEQQKMTRHNRQASIEKVSQEGVFIRSANNTHKKIRYKDILCLTADKGYTHIYCKEEGTVGYKYYTVPVPIGSVVQQLNHSAIVRVHRSHYVNIQNVDEVRENDTFLAGVEVPIGRDYKEDFFSRITRISKK